MVVLPRPSENGYFRAKKGSGPTSKLTIYILHWINLKYSIPKCSSFFSRDDLLTNWFFLSCILVKVSSLNLTFCRTSSLQSDEEEEPRKVHWIVKPAWFFTYFFYSASKIWLTNTGGPSIDGPHCMFFLMMFNDDCLLFF